MATIFVDLGNTNNTRTFGDDDYIVIGEDGDNTLTFGDGDDQLTLDDGNNTLTFGSGEDTITAGDGNNTVTVKGAGISRTTLGNGNNTFTAGDGTARVAIGNGVNKVTTGDGDSTIAVGNGDGNSITVGAGRNRITLGTGDTNEVIAAAGDNVVFVRAGDLTTDSIRGGVGNADGSGNTVVLTTFGAVGASGVSGFETFSLADGGRNSLTLIDANFARLPGRVITVLGGDSGNRLDASGLSAAHGVTAMAGAGSDAFTGGASLFDTLSYTASTAGVAVNLLTGAVSGGDAAGDVISGFENVLGGAGADSLVGSAGKNSLRGNAGNDMLMGGEGNDTLSGGDGQDTLNGGLGADRMDGGNGDDLYVVDQTGDRVSEALASGGLDAVQSSVSFVLGLNLETLTLAGNAYRATGNDAANRLTGTGLSNELLGLGGNDTLLGGGGVDKLRGGTGADRLTGGADADVFVFDTALGGGNIDALVDFLPGDDRIFLSAAIFTTLPPGALATDAFFIGAVAADAEDRILYNSAAGTLSYDLDGTGSGAAVRFATLATGLGLAAGDFAVIA